MINTETFTEEHIRNIQKSTKRDPALIERTIFALGLLEALVRSELPFTFKGGTSLILLLDKPRRFSTDIDIIVPLRIDVEKYLETAAKIFPFIKMIEHIRKTESNIEKRHFKFTFSSPTLKEEHTILLDILFEENPYTTVIKKNIESELLLTEFPPVFVNIPNANCILADKLTAFAPNTTGIPYNINKEMEIIKQLYDIASLIDKIDDFSEVKANYYRIAKSELKYRSINAKPEDALNDTIKTSICVASRGQYYNDEYLMLKKGISSLRNHIFSENFSGEIAVQRACMVIYIASAVLSNKSELPSIKEDSYYLTTELNAYDYKKLASIRKTDMLAYKYLVEAFDMIVNCLTPEEI